MIGFEAGMSSSLWGSSSNRMLPHTTLISPPLLCCQAYAAEIETLRERLVSEGRRAGVLGAQVSALQGQAGLAGDSVALLAATQVG